MLKCAAMLASSNTVIPAELAFRFVLTKQHPKSTSVAEMGGQGREDEYSCVVYVHQTRTDWTAFADRAATLERIIQLFNPPVCCGHYAEESNYYIIINEINLL